MEFNANPVAALSVLLPMTHAEREEPETTHGFLTEVLVAASLTVSFQGEI